MHWCKTLPPGLTRESGSLPPRSRPQRNQGLRKKERPAGRRSAVPAGCSPSLPRTPASLPHRFPARLQSCWCESTQKTAKNGLKQETSASTLKKPPRAGRPKGSDIPSDPFPPLPYHHLPGRQLTGLSPPQQEAGEAALHHLTKGTLPPNWKLHLGLLM